MSEPDANEPVSIVPYQPAYAADYKRLNLAWIEHYFTVEPHDLEQLDNPGPYIVERGGHVLFAKLGDEIVGTCALIRTGEHDFELAKMSIAAHVRGKKRGEQLGAAAVAQARSAGATRIWLESNRVLVPALTLYRKLGFVEVPMEPTLYARADIRMELRL